MVDGWDYQVVVIGSGAAGLMAAIHAASGSGAVRCALMTDGALGRSNSIMAQGGLQLPRPGDEALHAFEEDIRRSARDDVDADRVRTFVENVEATLSDLVDWGLLLDRDESGEVVRRTAGGLSEPRVVSVRDQIGPAIVKVLRKVVEQSDVEILEHTMVVDLRPRDGGIELDVIDGDGNGRSVCSRAVVCCTGGVTYREAVARSFPTTNPANRNHELFDKLRDLGIPLIQADYYQYQPYGIVETWGSEVGKCVPESIINFPVRLLDRDRVDIGEIRRDRYELTHLMFDLAEAGRAVELEDGRRGFWLTLSEVGEEDLERAFPKVHRFLQRAGKLGHDILVYPFLHYYLGGFRTGPMGSTDIPGLYLAGEMVGGLHGRNRLMGNGITDSLVHGAIAGRAVREYVGR